MGLHFEVRYYARMKLVSTNPSKNHQVIGEVGVSTAEEVKAKVAAARAAKKVRQGLGVPERVVTLRKVSQRLLAIRIA